MGKKSSLSRLFVPTELLETQQKENCYIILPGDATACSHTDWATTTDSDRNESYTIQSIQPQMLWCWK